MGDRRVSLFGASYRLFSVGVLQGCKAVPYPAPTAPNLLIKHSHLHFGHLDCSTKTLSLVVTTAGRASEQEEQRLLWWAKSEWQWTREIHNILNWEALFLLSPRSGATLTIRISGQTQLTLIDYGTNMKLRRQNIQQVWVFFFTNDPISTHVRIAGATSFLQGRGGVHPGQVAVGKHQQAFTPALTLRSL